MDTQIGKGGDAGEVFIAARKIVGGPQSKITADGGDGSEGGRGGKVTLITEDNQFEGEISAKGGKSFDFGNINKWWFVNFWNKYLWVIISGVIIVVVGGLILKKYFNI